MKSRFFHQIEVPSMLLIERLCAANNKGVKRQWRIQNPLAIAPNVSGFLRIELIIENILVKQFANIKILFVTPIKL